MRATAFRGTLLRGFVEKPLDVAVTRRASTTGAAGVGHLPHGRQLRLCDGLADFRLGHSQAVTDGAGRASGAVGRGHHGELVAGVGWLGFELRLNLNIDGF